jgi:hypothetical protein
MTPVQKRFKEYYGNYLQRHLSIESLLLRANNRPLFISFEHINSGSHPGDNVAKLIGCGFTPDHGLKDYSLQILYKDYRQLTFDHITGHVFKSTPISPVGVHIWLHTEETIELNETALQSSFYFQQLDVFFPKELSRVCFSYLVFREFYEEYILKQK